MASAVAVHTKGHEFCIVGANEVIDFLDEVGGGIERATTDGASVMRAKKRSTRLSQEIRWA